MDNDGDSQNGAQEVKDLTHLVQQIKLEGTEQNEKYMTDANGKRIEYTHPRVQQR
jgi:hypothetical protein